MKTRLSSPATKRKKFLHRHRSDERGIALIVTLAILAMLTVLLVAFVSSVRTERIASRAFTEEARARMAAQTAVEAAIFQMRTNMYSPNFVSFVTNRRFITGSYTNTIPDTLIYSSVAGAWVPGFPTNNMVGAIQLCNTNTSNLYANNFDIVGNLNEQGLIFPRSFVSNVWVPWVYCNNSWASNSAQTNRCVIRWTYWIEDNDTKININTAYNTTNGSTTGHNRSSDYTVSGIDLRGIPGLHGGGVYANLVATNRAPTLGLPPYETVAAIMEITNLTWSNAYYSSGAGPAASVFATVCSGDYERQTNGTMRLRLSDFGAGTPGTDVTNLVAAIGATNASDTVYLCKGIPGFTNKFGTRGSYQLAANIRDMMDTDDLPTDSETTLYSTNGYLGIEHVPYLNEYQLSTDVYISNPGNGPLYQVAVTNRVVWEFFNLWDTTCFLKTNITITAGSPASATFTWTGATPGTTNFASTNLMYRPGGNVGTNTVGAYSYAVYTNNTGMVFTFTTNGSPTLAVSCPASGIITNLWGCTNGPGFYRQDLAWLPARAAYSPATITLATSMVSNLTTAVHATVGGLGDPRLNNLNTDWSTTAQTNFGSANGAYSPGGAGGDVNTAADVATDGGFPFQNGPFPSPGFLGNVSYPATTNDWMTLKFYGDGYSNYNTSTVATRVPDYALLDLFTTNTPGAFTTGKINVNNWRDKMLDPSSYGSTFALLAGINLYTGSSLSTNTGTSTMLAIATNIIINAPYYTIGDFASSGALTNTAGLTTDERREALIRTLSNITTVRANYYTIWGRGQVLTTLRGNTNILGEAFIRADVQRIPYHDDATGKVTNQSFKVKSYRYLSE